MALSRNDPRIQLKSQAKAQAQAQAQPLAFLLAFYERSGDPLAWRELVPQPLRHSLFVAGGRSSARGHERPLRLVTGR